MQATCRPQPHPSDDEFDEVDDVLVAGEEADGIVSSSSSSESSSSSSSSAGDAPPGPAPPAVAAAPAPAAGVAAFRMAAAYVVFCPGGKVVCYGDRMVAECCNPRHGRCVATRTLKGSDNPERSGQGRPAGYLIAWLRKGSEDRIGTKKAHFDDLNAPTKAERQAARDWLKAKVAEAGDADAAGILRAEREKRGGEDSEPDVVPGGGKKVAT